MHHNIHRIWKTFLWKLRMVKMDFYLHWERWFFHIFQRCLQWLKLKSLDNMLPIIKECIYAYMGERCHIYYSIFSGIKHWLISIHTITLEHWLSKSLWGCLITLRSNEKLRCVKRWAISYWQKRNMHIDEQIVFSHFSSCIKHWLISKHNLTLKAN